MLAPPLNRDRDFTVWPHFDPGALIDTNAGCVRLASGEAWAVFCRYRVPPQPGRGSIWAVRVDDRMQPCGAPVPILGEGIDPRVIRVGRRVLIFYAVIERDPAGPITGSAMVLAEFAVSGGNWRCIAGFRLPKHPILKDRPPDSLDNWEKNWVPFPVDETHVGLIYSHDPWDVIVLNVADPEHPAFASVHASPALQWDYGTIRGGTPPVPFDAAHLVTFFHAAQLVGSRRVYTVGACVFRATPAYAPVRVTPEPLLVAPYRTGAHRFGWPIAISAVFPLGATRTADGYVLLCGRDDGEVASFAIMRHELEARLAPPCAGPAGTLHDYRGTGARLPLGTLLCVPDPVPQIPDLPKVNFLRMVAGHGRTFVDIGAGIGGCTIGLAPGFRRVLALEPSPPDFAWLRRNAALNGYPHVQCEQPAPDRVADPLDGRGLNDVDLLRINANGSAADILRGAAETIRAARPAILIEGQDGTPPREQAQAALDDLDYTMEFQFPFTPGMAICLPRERRTQYDWFI